MKRVDDSSDASQLDFLDESPPLKIRKISVDSLEFEISDSSKEIISLNKKTIKSSESSSLKVSDCSHSEEEAVAEKLTSKRNIAELNKSLMLLTSKIDNLLSSDISNDQIIKKTTELKIQVEELNMEISKAMKKL